MQVFTLFLLLCKHPDIIILFLQTYLQKTVSEWDRSPLPTEPVDTLKPFVPTTSPVDKAESEKKSMRKVTTLLKKLVNGYSELFKNKTDHLTVVCIASLLQSTIWKILVFLLLQLMLLCFCIMFLSKIPKNSYSKHLYTVFDITQKFVLKSLNSQNSSHVNVPMACTVQAKNLIFMISVLERYSTALKMLSL